MWRDAKKNNKGQAMVEFLFVIILFISIVLVTLQFTLISNAKSILSVAAYACNRKDTHPINRRWERGNIVDSFLKPIRGNLLSVGVKHNPSLGSAKFGKKQKTTVTIHYKTPMFKIFGGKKYVVLKSSSSSFMAGSYEGT